MHCFHRSLVLFMAVCLCAFANADMGEEVDANLTKTPLRLQLDLWQATHAPVDTESESSLFRLGGGLNVGQSDLPGLKRDTAYFMGLQATILGLLYLAPESISGWSDEQINEYGFDEWGDNVTNVSWDSDRWWINYILHPYWGATYFTRARERNFDRRESFWYSALLSSLYEFGGEALFEEPSVQDLIVTPVAGTLVGFWFENVRNRIHSKADPISRGDRLILTLTDPIGAAGRYADKLLQIDQHGLRLGFVPTSNSTAFTVIRRW